MKFEKCLRHDSHELLRSEIGIFEFRFPSARRSSRSSRSRTRLMIILFPLLVGWEMLGRTTLTKAWCGVVNTVFTGWFDLALSFDGGELGRIRNGKMVIVSISEKILCLFHLISICRYWGLPVYFMLWFRPYSACSEAFSRKLPKAILLDWFEWGAFLGAGRLEENK